jgi:hypothetical protein
MQIKRLGAGPIIYPDMDSSLGSNINGPSMIRVPNWIENPLGKYYLYFAHHDGDHIRLAYSDDVAGPWRIHRGGVLNLQQAGFAGHIASPDVHVDHKERQIRLYYHGSDSGTAAYAEQTTRLARSADGLCFESSPTTLGPAYIRVFQWHDKFYALAMPGLFFRSLDGTVKFVEGPQVFDLSMRHSAIKLDDDRLTVFYSNIGDCPECILCAAVTLIDDWMHWEATPPSVVLLPEHDYEGADLVLEPSVSGMAYEPIRQLRDPAVFRDDGRDYLLYVVAGEAGIAIAEIID